MILKLLRLGANVAVNRGESVTLEIQDRTLFTRVLRSLLTEAGKHAEEPYLLVHNDGAVIAPKKGLLLVNALPELPFRDRTLVAKLYQCIATSLELDSELYMLIQELAFKLNNGLEDVANGMWGDYAFANEWKVDAYCKAFGFSPIAGEGYSLLDNCIRFLGLCTDANLNCPVVLVNAKSFLSQTELEDLFEQVFFLDAKLVLLESWPDNRIINRERKTTIDLHFLVEER